MNQIIDVPRIKLGVEDLQLESGTVQQERQGNMVHVESITASTMPFGNGQTLAERLEEINASADLVEALGPQLAAVSMNIAKLIILEQTAIDSTNGNAGFLQGSNLAQVRANIDAALLEGSNLAAVRAGIDAIQLEGADLAALRTGINAAQLGGSDLAAVRTGIDATTLQGQTLAQVREGGDAATLQGSDKAAVVAAMVSADATTTTAGVVRLPTDAEKKAGTTTSAVPTEADLRAMPMELVAYLNTSLIKDSDLNYTIRTEDKVNWGTTGNGGDINGSWGRYLDVGFINGFAVFCVKGTSNTGSLYQKVPLILPLVNKNFIDFGNQSIGLWGTGSNWNSAGARGNVEFFIAVYGVKV